MWQLLQQDYAHPLQLNAAEMQRSRTLQESHDQQVCYQSERDLLVDLPVKAPYNDALYTDNRVTTTKTPKTVGLHCKFPPYNSNDARYNVQPDWQSVAV